MGSSAIEAVDLKKTYTTTRGLFRRERVGRAALGYALFRWLEQQALRGGLQEAY